MDTCFRVTDKAATPKKETHNLTVLNFLEKLANKFVNLPHDGHMLCRYCSSVLAGGHLKRRKPSWSELNPYDYEEVVPKRQNLSMNILLVPI
jgi:hypothetical protein